MKAMMLVLKSTGLGPLLEKIYSRRKIKNKTVRLLEKEVSESISDCHLVFISESEEKRLSEILANTKNRPVLTVGDTKGFAEKGVIVNFYLDEKKVRFEINESAARAAGLSIS
ncbi:MAG: hypothetical protein B6245_05805 [Desulfobacteraceae bacterium 4572_88]|nr:MAG: hypothetical protein B6245_05805 [Desulfobacteraceae bacterium 4572_88]